MNQLPFVSCLCITGKDEFHTRELLPVSVSSFHQQDYPEDLRELLLLTDGADDLARFACSNVRVVRVPRQPSLGELRNISLALAWESHPDGAWCHWDDDDWHGPARLTVQVNGLLAQSQAKACFLFRQIAWDSATDTAIIRETGKMIVGTPVAWNSARFTYPSQAKGEDAIAAASLLPAVVLANDPAIYVRISHGSNTWDQQHILRWGNETWARGSWHLCDKHRALLRKVLRLYQGGASTVFSTAQPIAASNSEPTSTQPPASS